MEQVVGSPNHSTCFKHLAWSVQIACCPVWWSPLARLKSLGASGPNCLGYPTGRPKHWVGPLRSRPLRHTLGRFCPTDADAAVTDPGSPQNVWGSWRGYSEVQEDQW